MKYRLDFVTNSSSSSFICDVCGAHVEGWDMSLSEAEMYECVNGHTICEDELLEKPNFREFLESVIDDEDKELLNSEVDEYELESMAMDYEFRYYLPEKYCPICNFVVYSESDMAQYLLKKIGVTRAEVFEEVKKINKRRKKLYDSEYIQYVCQKHSLDVNEIVKEIKDTYKTYKEFEQSIR